MLRFRHGPVAMVVLAFALAGCSSASTPSWMPSWLTPKPPPPPTVVLQFESAPPGADVHTVDGQTCKTPCSLALPLTSQAVSFGLNGYLPQTVPVAVGQSGEPNFEPNPLLVTLQSAKPAPRPRPKPRKPHVAAKPAMPAGQPSIASPEPAGPDNSFPPPPQMAAPGQSPFPPPPPTR